MTTNAIKLDKYTNVWPSQTNIPEGEHLQEILYLGPEGTFSEAACQKYLRTVGYQGVAMGRDYPTIPEVIAAAAADTNCLAIVPMENSSEGSVNVTLDILAAIGDKLKICGEVILPVHHHLLGLPGTKIEQVEEVLSHPQALGQCQQSLGLKIPGVRQIATASTAEAARLVAKEKQHSLVAIGTLQAALQYGLVVLVPEIQDAKSNCTRFVLLGHQLNAPTGHDKTSLVFTTTDKPGSLYKILDVMASRGINLTKIESRPTGKRLGEYLFHLDLEGHCQDKIVIEAIESMSALTSWMQMLGSYPQAAKNLQS